MRDDPFLLRAIIDADPDMMWAVDAEKLELVWWNDSAARHVGDQGVMELKGHHKRALETGVFCTETEWASGLWMALEFTPLLREGRSYAVLGVGRDVTERKRVEREREEALQLRQSQKVEALGQLAGGIAHDFNNLLTAVLGYTDLLLASPEGGAEPMRLDLLEIKGAAMRAADLTQHILTFSRKQALCPELISIDDVEVTLAGRERSAGHPPEGGARKELGRDDDVL